MGGGGESRTFGERDRVLEYSVTGCRPRKVSKKDLRSGDWKNNFLSEEGFFKKNRQRVDSPILKGARKPVSEKSQFGVAPKRQRIRTNAAKESKRSGQGREGEGILVQPDAGAANDHQNSRFGGKKGTCLWEEAV